MYAIIRIFLIVPALLLAACSSTVHIEAPPTLSPDKAVLTAEQPDHLWWQLRFKLAWPEDESPDFSRHLLIAEQILLPVIAEHEQQLPLWRFHRRAGRDGAGHQFSFIFMSDEATAMQIDKEVNENPLTGWLLDRAMIEKTRFNSRSPDELGKLEQTSDASWPLEIQRSWPYFIMGVSQTWLMMVQELSQQNALEGEIDYPTLLEHYKKVDAKLNIQWRDYGQHAYLHHLNAVYGYQPIKIRSTELKSF